MFRFSKIFIGNTNYIKRIGEILVNIHQQGIIQPLLGHRTLKEIRLMVGVALMEYPDIHYSSKM